MKSLAPLLALSLLAPTVVWGASFTVNSATNTAQTLNGNNDIGTVTSTGTITLGGSTVDVTISGNNTTLNNSGAIIQSGSGRAVQANGTGISITNNAGALIQSDSTDGIRAGNSNAATSISLNNAGTIQVINGGQAIDWNGIATGSNTITNSGLIKATGEDAVRLGANGRLTNTGTVQAAPVSGSGSDGVDMQTVSGAVIVNSGVISGRHGITGGNTVFTITATNNAGGLIAAINGSGINIDGVFATSSATVFNSGTITGNYDGVSATGDGDGVDVDGVLNLTNNGVIRGLGAFGAGNNSEGVAAGGGTITNNTGAEISGQITTGGGGAVGNGILIDDGNGGSGVAATTITNAGLIRGYTGFGIKISGSFNDTVTNEATGTVRGALGAAVQTGGGDDIVTNRGTIIGDNGAAVALEDGNDTLVVEGGVASIVGDIDGGTGSNTLTLKPGTGNTFSYGGVISNFSSAEVNGGKVILSGSNTYSGPTTVTSGTLLANNTAGSATGTGNVTVKNAALLGGTGSISGTSTVQSGGTVTGNEVGTIGTLTLGALDLESGGVFHFDLNTNTLSHDLLVVGDLTLNGSTLVLNDLNTTALSLGTIIDLIDFNTLAPGSFAGLSEGATFFVGVNEFQISYGQTVAGEVTVEAIPEPTSLALISLGLAGTAFYARRRASAQR